MKDHGFRIRQLTPEQRRDYDAAEKAATAEVLGALKSQRNWFGRAVDWVGDALASIGEGTRRIATRDNLDTIMRGSAAFGRMAAVVGVDAAKAALLRRVEGAVGSAFSGGTGGGSDGAKVR